MPRASHNDNTGRHGKRPALTLALAAALTLLVSSCGGPDAKAGSRDRNPLRIESPSGVLVGSRDGTALAFLGIPYAEPPVGARRWQPPAPVKPWRAPLRADTLPPPCLQAEPKGGQVSGAEDCLYLNVWKPATRTGNDPLPVMVFVHGGGNVRGSTSVTRAGVPIYDGAKLAARGNVIIVTIQYRLGPFGYLALPSLDQASPTGTSGNWALMDQMLALAWVRDNIAAFGGDPDRVLLFGESGGATDVCALLASPLAAGLFDAVVIQSGACTAKPRAAVVAWSEHIVKGVDCAAAADTLACLRARPGSEILAAAQLMTTDKGDVVSKVGPTLDGYVLPDQPVAIFSRGEHVGVPVIVGVNAEETAAPLFGIPWRLSARQYRSLLEARFPSTFQDILKLYPASAYASPRAALVAVTTDQQFLCPARLYARALDRGQDQPVYRYLFAHTMTGRPGLLGAAHGFELMYLFQHIQDFDDYTATAADLQVEKLLLQLWTAMARSGQAASEQVTTWPTYDAGNDPYLVLANPAHAAHGLRTEKCNFWDTTYHPKMVSGTIQNGVRDNSDR